ncbi:hypothetical protein HYE60_11815 [Aggregatibacter actinomycetemcomitans]|uniref:hypothetical protein n=1 Tax=Aggregatibacter actinomycetemcomitans TaxID=714 RepID=UPI00197C8097|nr:hypothetical protein [Aggregatibacter actinomycetemcomitans]MBN6075911.1 hypothetical protein [Aggregatibacter actinomycetemcomitans]
MQTIEESAKQLFTATQFFVNHSVKGLIESGKIRKEDEERLVLAFMGLMEKEAQEFKQEFDRTLAPSQAESSVFSY